MHSLYQEVWSCLYLNRVTKSANKLLYMRNVFFLSLPGPPISPAPNTKGKPASSTFPSSPLHQLSVCSSLANCDFLHEMGTGVTLACGAGAGQGRGSWPHCGGARHPLPSESAKEVRRGLQTIVAAHAFFIMLAFCLENITHPTSKLLQA